MWCEIYSFSLKAANQHYFEEGKLQKRTFETLSFITLLAALLKFISQIRHARSSSSISWNPDTSKVTL